MRGNELHKVGSSGIGTATSLMLTANCLIKAGEDVCYCLLIDLYEGPMKLDYVSVGNLKGNWCNIPGPLSSQ